MRTKIFVQNCWQTVGEFACHWTTETYKFLIKLKSVLSELFVGTLEKLRRPSGMSCSVWFCVPLALASAVNILA
jgi:hypothetical protein